MSNDQSSVQMRLDEARFRLAAIAESSDDAIVGKDLNGVVTSWNKAAEVMFGYPADEMIGQPITRIIPPTRVDEEASILDRIRRGERIVHFVTERQCRDGSVIPVSLTVSPIRISDLLSVAVDAGRILRRASSGYPNFGSSRSLAHAPRLV